MNLTDPNSIAEKMKFSIKDFFSKCDQIRSFQRIWSHLLKKSLMENLIFYAVSCRALSQIDFYFTVLSFTVLSFYCFSSKEILSLLYSLPILEKQNVIV